MDIDISSLDRHRAYSLLASVVVPRPIAFVSTVDENGVLNAAPFSFFNLVGGNPLVVALGVADRQPGVMKDTRANIERSGEFVVNLVDENIAQAMNLCAIDFPPNVSEFDMANLTPVASTRVAPPGIAESPVQIECRLHTIVPIGNNRIVLAEVVYLHIRDEFIDVEKMHVRTENLDLIGRMHGGGWYARTSDLFDMPRPTYADWKKTH